MSARSLPTYVLNRAFSSIAYRRLIRRPSGSQKAHSRQCSTSRTNSEFEVWQNIYDRDFLQRKRLSEFMGVLTVMVQEKGSTNKGNSRCDSLIQTIDTDVFQLDGSPTIHFVEEFMRAANTRDAILDLVCFERIIDEVKPILQACPNITFIKVLSLAFYLMFKSSSVIAGFACDSGRRPTRVSHGPSADIYSLRLAWPGQHVHFQWRLRRPRRQRM